MQDADGPLPTSPPPERERGASSRGCDAEIRATVPCVYHPSPALAREGQGGGDFPASAGAADDGAEEEDEGAEADEEADAEEDARDADGVRQHAGGRDRNCPPTLRHALVDRE